MTQKKWWEEVGDFDLSQQGSQKPKWYEEVGDFDLTQGGGEQPPEPQEQPTPRPRLQYKPKPRIPIFKPEIEPVAKEMGLAPRDQEEDTEEGVIRRYSDLIWQGAKQVPRAMIGGLEAAAHLAGKGEVLETPGVPESLSSIGPGLEKALHEGAEWEGFKPPEGWKPPQNIFEGAAFNIPQMVGQVGSWMAAGPVASTMYMFSQIGGQQYHDLVEQGVDKDRAMAASLANAGVQLPLEYIGLGKVLKPWMPSHGIMKSLAQWGKRAGTEGLTEWLQKFPEEITYHVASHPGEEFGKMMSDIVGQLPDWAWEGAKWDAPIGAILGGFFSAPGAMYAIKNDVDSARYRDARDREVMNLVDALEYEIVNNPHLAFSTPEAFMKMEKDLELPPGQGFTLAAQYSNWSPELAQKIADEKEKLLPPPDRKLLPPGEERKQIEFEREPVDFDVYSPEVAEFLRWVHRPGNYPIEEQRVEPAKRQLLPDRESIETGPGFVHEELTPEETAARAVEAAIEQGNREALERATKEYERAQRTFDRTSAVIRNILRENPGATIGEVYRQAKTRGVNINRQDLAKIVNSIRKPTKEKVSETQKLVSAEPKQIRTKLEAEVKKSGLNEMQDKYAPGKVGALLFQELKTAGLTNGEARAQVESQITQYTEQYNSVVQAELARREAERVEAENKRAQAQKEEAKKKEARKEEVVKEERKEGPKKKKVESKYSGKEFLPGQNVVADGDPGVVVEPTTEEAKSLDLRLQRMVEVDGDRMPHAMGELESAKDITPAKKGEETTQVRGEIKQKPVVQEKRTGEKTEQRKVPKRKKGEEKLEKKKEKPKVKDEDRDMIRSNIMELRNHPFREQGLNSPKRTWKDFHTKLNKYLKSWAPEHTYLADHFENFMYQDKRSMAINVSEEAMSVLHDAAGKMGLELPPAGVGEPGRVYEVKTAKDITDVKEGNTVKLDKTMLANEGFERRLIGNGLKLVAVPNSPAVFRVESGIGPDYTAMEKPTRLKQKGKPTANDLAIENYLNENLNNEDHAEYFAAIKTFIRRMKRRGTKGVSAVRGNPKTIMSIDISTDCPMRQLGKPCLYCYVENPRTWEKMGKQGVNHAPKVIGYAPYNNEILEMPQGLVDFMNDVLGGLRVFSLGDFTPQTWNTFDRILKDARKRGLTLKAITKQPMFIEAFGNKEGVIINVSTDFDPSHADVITDHKALQQLIADEAAQKETISVAPTKKQAIRWKEKYKNVKIRYVAVNRSDAIRAIADPAYDVVTIYHGFTNPNILKSIWKNRYPNLINQLGYLIKPLSKIFQATSPNTLANRIGQKELDEVLGKDKVSVKEFGKMARKKMCCQRGKCALCSVKCGFGVRDTYHTYVSEEDLGAPPTKISEAAKKIVIKSTAKARKNLVSLSGKLGKKVRTTALGITDALVNEGKVDLRGHKIESAEDLAVLAQPLRNPRYETLRYFFIKDGKIIHQEGVTSRLPDRAIAFISENPEAEMREIQKKIKALGADKVYMLHNHPSGNPAHSSHDGRLTAFVAYHIPELAGHVIIDSGRYSFLRVAKDESGEAHSILAEDNIDLPGLPGDWVDPVLSPAIPHEQLGTVIDSADKVAHVGKKLQAQDDYAVLMYADVNLVVRAIQEIKSDILNDPATLEEHIKQTGVVMGSTRVLLYIPESIPTGDLSINAYGDLIKRNVLVDVITHTEKGIRERAEIKPLEGFVLGEPEGKFVGEKVSETMATYEAKTPEQTIDDLFGEMPVNFRTKVKRTISKIKRWRKYLVDRYQPVKEVLGEHAYKMFRMLAGSDALFQAMMEKGIITIDKSGRVAIDRSRGGAGEFFKKHGEDARNMLYWAALQRAKRLEGIERKGRPKEKWLIGERRKVVEKHLEESGRSDEFYRNLYNEFKQHHEGVIRLAENMGLISEKQREAWLSEIYVPFYRVFQTTEGDEESKYPFSTEVIGSKLKEIYGAEMKLGDPIENVVANWAYIMRESLRNAAMSNAFDTARAIHAEEGGDPIVSEANKAGPDTISYMDKGQRKYMQLHNFELFQTIRNVNHNAVPTWFRRLFGTPKRWLTYGITRSPAFVLANSTRDTLASWVLTKNFIPFVDSVRGALHIMTNSDEYVRAMAAGALFGGSYMRADDPKSLQKMAKRMVPKEGKGKIINTFKGAWELYEKIIDASENAARMGIFVKNVKAGMPDFDAAYEARDITDFSNHGASIPLQHLLATVPFLGARAQGNYKFYRSFRENTLSFIGKGSLLALASLGLWALYADDDRYEELEDWDKWTYYHFWVGGEHYKIPKPFEVGVMFSSAFETAANLITNKEEKEFLKRFIWHTTTQTFAVDMPQLIKPAIEQWANKSFFTGRPIESYRLQGMKRGERYYSNTSELMRVAGKGLNISPTRMEELVNGYFGTLGSGVLTMMDAATRWFVDFPEKPTARTDDYPLIGRFWKQGPTKNNKYITRFYDMVDESEKLVKTVKHYMELGNMAEARQLMREHMPEYTYNKYLTKTRRQLSEIRKVMRTIEESDRYTSEEKRAKLDKYYKIRNRLTKSAYDIYMKALKKS